MTKSNKTTVYFDGSCPLCRREIAVYEKRNQGDVAFVDVSAIDAKLHDDLNRETAMSRFHVIGDDGALLQGGEAFVALWAKTPGFQYLSKIFQLPGMMLLANISYDVFLKIRPFLQWLARHFLREGKAVGE